MTIQPRQQDALLIIYNSVHEEEGSITYAELGEKMGIAEKNAYKHVQNLMDQGYAIHPYTDDEHNKRTPRGLMLSSKGIDKAKSCG